MGTCPEKILAQSFVSFLTEISQDEHDLPISRWSRMKEVAGLNPRSDLRAGNISSFSPGVRLAFHDNLFVWVAQVEAVVLLAVDANWNFNVPLKVDALLDKESLHFPLEVSAYIRVAAGSFTLERFVHPVLTSDSLIGQHNTQNTDVGSLPDTL